MPNPVGIYIENYKCINKLFIPLKKGILLIGENDTGKTTILKAIEFFTNYLRPRISLKSLEIGNFHKGNITYLLFGYIYSFNSFKKKLDENKEFKNIFSKIEKFYKKKHADIKDKNKHILIGMKIFPKILTKTIVLTIIKTLYK